MSKWVPSKVAPLVRPGAERLAGHLGGWLLAAGLEPELVLHAETVAVALIVLGVDVAVKALLQWRAR